MSKYWRPLTEDDYYDKMDAPMINLAIEEARFPKETIEKIWKIKREPFSVF